MTARLRAFGAFWYDFIIGDDWRVAAGVAVALTATYGLRHLAHTSQWWVVPFAVALLLPVSIYRVTRRSP